MYIQYTPTPSHIDIKYSTKIKPTYKTNLISNFYCKIINMFL
jgi:hypothetical protein